MLELTCDQPRRHMAPTVKATKLAYLIFQRTDLDQTSRFLTDFGLKLVHKASDEWFFRSADESPFCYVVKQSTQNQFEGLGLEVASLEDLVALTQLEEASEIKDVPYPGGGKRVVLQDPSGFKVEAIHGQARLSKLHRREPLPLNFNEQPTRVNHAQRPPITPPEILRLGHVVLEVADFQATSAWYTQHFGLIPSDVQVLPDGSPAVCFYRLDLGDTPADHHTLAMAQTFMPCYSHSAYELVDADAVGMGQRVMREKKWSHAWGIGRHILGSQIFDYWQDPCGDKHEHYCDGDLFTSDRPMGVHPVSREAMSQWGQVMPSSFTKPKINLTLIRNLIHSLRHSPDVTFKKLKTLKKIFS